MARLSLGRTPVPRGAYQHSCLPCCRDESETGKRRLFGWTVGFLGARRDRVCALNGGESQTSRDEATLLYNFIGDARNYYIMISFYFILFYLFSTIPDGTASKFLRLHTGNVGNSSHALSFDFLPQADRLLPSALASCWGLNLISAFRCVERCSQLPSSLC